MTPSPIHKVLSSMRKHRVQYLLMGGQACVLYGAAEFSRDADLAILASTENLSRLKKALRDLQAEVIAVPRFEKKHLEAGLAVHFRCNHPDALRVRIDVMSRMRGVDGFKALWERRTTLNISEDIIQVIALPDLVKAKKTQRDKDWPMIARLVEANYFQNRTHPSEEQIHFWLRELRTPALLVEVAARFPNMSLKAIPERSLLTSAIAGNTAELEKALREEEQKEREADRQYWLPLKKQLEKLREAKRQK